MDVFNLFLVFVFNVLIDLIKVLFMVKLVLIWLDEDVSCFEIVFFFFIFWLYLYFLILYFFVDDIFLIFFFFIEVVLFFIIFLVFIDELILVDVDLIFRILLLNWIVLVLLIFLNFLKGCLNLIGFFMLYVLEWFVILVVFFLDFELIFLLEINGFGGWLCNWILGLDEISLLFLIVLLGIFEVFLILFLLRSF